MESDTVPIQSNSIIARLVIELCRRLGTWTVLAGMVSRELLADCGTMRCDPDINQPSPAVEEKDACMQGRCRNIGIGKKRRHWHLTASARGEW